MRRSVVALLRPAPAETSARRSGCGVESTRRMRQTFCAELVSETWCMDLSDGGHRRGRRPHRAGQAQRWRGQQEAVAAVGAQPVGERRQVPDLAEVDAELE